MKKIIAILITLVFVTGMFTGCSSKKSDSKGSTDTSSTSSTKSDTSAGKAKPFKYGFVSWGTADEHGRTLNSAVKWAVDAAGGKFVMDGTATTAETTIAAAENLIQSGCNMICFCTYAGEATVPQISKLCQENKVYWTMFDTTIADKNIAAMIEKDPYYVGSTNEDQYTAGYNVMKQLIAKGAKNTILVKYGTKIPTCDERCRGAEAAAKEAGTKILYTIVAPDDYKKAAQDALVSYPDCDSFFLAGSGRDAASIIAASKAAGRKCELGVFDYFDQMGDYLKSGDLTVINGGHMVTGTFSALMAINAYFGTPLSDKKINLTIPYLTLASDEDYAAYKKYASKGAAYTSDELKQYLKIYNKNLTLDSFQKGVSKWSIADIKERKGIN